MSCQYCQQANGHLSPTCPSAQSERLADLNQQLAAERAKVAELERQLAEAKEDTARLTQALHNGDVHLYLERHGGTTAYCIDYRNYGTHSLTDTGVSLHDAISAMTLDAARKETK